MAGDVRGSFSLNDRPATAAMRRLKREGEQLDVTLTKLGKTVDGVFSKRNVAQVVAYERALAKLDTQARRTFNSVGRNARKAETQVTTSIRKMDTSVALFRENLERLDKVRATPTIDLDGLTAALTQIELVHKRLNALGRETARPRVGVPVASRATAAVGGGGGGTGFSKTTGLRNLNLGPFTIGPQGYPVVIGGALAALPPLTGATVGLGGSLGAAALGAGSVGLGAAGVGVAGLGMSVPVVASSVSAISSASDALEGYREEVLKSGVNSEQARLAYREMNMELSKAPRGTRRFLAARDQLSEEFRAETGPARAATTRIGTRGINLARQLTPQFGGLSNDFFAAAQPQADQFSDFLSSPEARAFYDAMGKEAELSLRPTENIAENITGTFMNLSRAARPFFREGLQFLDRWTAGWHDSSKDIGEVRSDMERWISHLRTWAKLTGETFDLLSSLGSAGAGEGQSLVADLTEQLEVWDRWVERNPQKVRAFFEESVDSTKKIAGAVGQIATTLWEIGRALEPLLTQFSELVSLLGNAGLLTPGGLPLLIAAGAGVRAGTRGLGGRIRGGGAGGGGVGAAGALAAGAALGGGLAGRGLGAGAPRVSPTLRTPYGPIATPLYDDFGRSQGALRRVGAGTRGFAGRFAPFAAVSAALSAISASDELGLGERFIQAPLSALTLGGINQPRTPLERSDTTQEVLGKLFQQIGQPGEGTPAQQRQAISRLLAARGGDALAGTIAGGSDASVAEVEEAIEKALPEYRRRRAGTEAGRTIHGIGRAYDIRVNRGDVSPEDAFDKAAGGIQRGLRDAPGRQAQRAMGRQGLMFLNNLRELEPSLKTEINEAADAIEQRLRRMGHNIRIINGEIRDVSADQWSSIRKKMASEMEMARQETMDSFTALQVQAVEVLKSMGFTPGQARGLVATASEGKTKGQRSAAKRIIGHGSVIPFSPDYIQRGTSANSGTNRGNARGGRLSMPANGSMHDDVALGNGEWGAGGELMVNRHTERRINRMLGGATTIGREVAHENRAHSQMPPGVDYALGGRLGRRLATGGIMAAGRLAASMGLNVGEGPGYGGIPTSGHTGGSLHYQGLAYDVSGSPELMRRYFYSALRRFRGSINELFYDPIGFYIDQGQRVPGAIGGHGDHVHIGFDAQGARSGVGGFRGGGRGGGGVPDIALRARRSGRGGVAGAMVNRAGQMAAAGMSARLNQLLQRQGGGARMPGFAGGGGRLSKTQLTRLAAGAGMSNANLMAAIAMAESGGDPRVTNSIGARGLWQIIPSTAEAFGLDYGRLTNPAYNAFGAAKILRGQGLGAWEAYTNGAYSRFLSTGGRRRGFAGWFGEGGRGRVHGPTMIGLGESGPEDFEITPTPKRSRAGRRGGRDRPIEVNVNMGGVKVASGQDAQQIGSQIGEAAARRLTAALRDGDEVAEEELIGA